MQSLLFHEKKHNWKKKNCMNTKHISIIWMEKGTWWKPFTTHCAPSKFKAGAALYVLLVKH